jgi:hypothetical protein
MKAKKALLLLLVCALVLFVLATTADAKSAERPFKGSVSGTVWFTPGAELGLPPNPNPPFLWTISHAVGNVTHLGRTVMDAHHPTPSSDVISGGTMVLRVANGDKLFVTYAGTAPFPVIGVPSTIRAHTPMTVTGGTGRFVGASGRVDCVGYVQFPGELGPGPWPGVWYFKGTISY